MRAQIWNELCNKRGVGPWGVRLSLVSLTSATLLIGERLPRTFGCNHLSICEWKSELPIVVFDGWIRLGTPMPIFVDSGACDIRQRIFAA